MPICTYCGIILEDGEAKAHNALPQAVHDDNKTKMKDDQRTRRVIRAV